MKEILAHNPTGKKVSSNTSKNLDTKLEIKRGKFGNVGTTGKNTQNEKRK